MEQEDEVMGACKNEIVKFFLGLFLIFFGFGGLTTGFLLSSSSFAAVFNVITDADLHDALLKARNNGEADTIVIRAGDRLNKTPFRYTAASGENFALTIMGEGVGQTLDGERARKVLLIDTFSNLEDDSNAHITIKNLSITNGRSTDGFGGGLFVCTGSANVTIENSTFFNNSATFPGSAFGGGAEIDTLSGDVTLTKNRFSSNSVMSSSESAFGGGIDILTESGDVILKDNTFTDNFSASSNSSFEFFTSGGGANVFTSHGTITLTNNIFTRNRATSSLGSTSGGGASVRTDEGTITLTVNIFTNNSINSSKGFTQDAQGGGTDVFTNSGNVTLTSNIFVSNSVRSSDSSTPDVFGGGAVIGAGSGTIKLAGNTFGINTVDSSNSSSVNAFAGGAEVFTDSGGITLTNNIFHNNSATSSFIAFGGGADVSTGSGTITLTNNTLTLNSATDGGGLNAGAFKDTSTINIFNNIIRGNIARNDIFLDEDGDGNGTASPVNLFNNDFFACFSSFADATPCTNFPHINNGNNIMADPLFVDAANGDIHLKSGSLAINRGDPLAPALPDTDIDGNPRIIGPAPDMGADEFVLPELVIVNNLVTFEPIKSTFKTTSDTTDCPPGFVGKFMFDAMLTNTSSERLSDLMLVEVKILTNDNLLLNADGGPGGVGTTLTIFSSGVFSPGESVRVPFIICLKNKKRFGFFVDVLGIVQ
ncbi:MAG TPA: right-handed parallel beta-helix repeat-containing protein [Thermodesulfobacteriota bacterium]|nr:right-handed parallel beta-helix repeat-containing protein [Thermodesulfobacteriota bacterium]